MPGKVMIEGHFRQATGCPRTGRVIADVETGLITDVLWDFPSPGQAEEPVEQVWQYGPEYVIEAGDFNAHSHPEQSLYTDLVDRSWDLPTWCRNTIYKYSPRLEPEHIYLACCRAFSRMLTLGVTSVMVSFYCHNRAGNRYDREVLKAAKDTGIRLYFGRMNYDILTEDAYPAKKASQQCYFETPELAQEFCLELMREVKHPRITVAPSVHSIHASTKAAIVKALNLGYEGKRYVQFHLSEDQGDVRLAQEWYGMRPVEFLVSLVEAGEVPSIGHMLLSDCVWVDEHEWDLVQENNIRVVLNPRMNQRIKAGEAYLPGILARRIMPYLGTDGEASNDDLSITGERHFLQLRWSEIPQDVFPKLGTQPLRLGEGLVGGIAPGYYCDLKVLQDGKVVDLFVGAERVLKDGRLCTLDQEMEVEEPLRRAVKRLQAE